MYDIGLKCSVSEAQEWWGFPSSIEDIRNLFVSYIRGDVKYLPWSDSPISAEIQTIRERLVGLNRSGFLTINSQPAINGEKSSHPIYGWGPRNGYVYQKAYLECFCHPSMLDRLLSIIEKDQNITFHAVNKHGDLRTNTYSDGPNAVTWGVYPGKEIIQPTIVETVSFLAWKVTIVAVDLADLIRTRHIV
jgi:methylenetetrahydrofolate reductase (NADPH)